MDLPPPSPSSSSSPPPLAASYVVTHGRPTTVSHALTCNLTPTSGGALASASSPTTLVTALTNRLEISDFTDSSQLQLRTTINLHGHITSLSSYTPTTSKTGTAYLFVLTARLKYCILACTPTGTITTLAFGSLADHLGSPPTSGSLVAVSPTYIVCHVYAGYLKVLPLSPTGVPTPGFNVRLDETDGITSLTFLSKDSVGVLFTDGKGRSYLKCYGIDTAKKAVKANEPWVKYQVESGANMLISCPALSGVLIVGRKTITFHNGASTKSVPMSATIVTCYGQVGGDQLRFLVGDYLGGLSVVVVLVKNDVVSGMHVEALGTTSIPSCLSYLDNGVVFVGSCYGDSMLVKLEESRNEAGDYLTYLNTYGNLGPIVDFTVADLDRRGQKQIVTCSGAKKEGSLRVVRNGIGVVSQAEVEIVGIKNMITWSVDNFDRYLVMSVAGETRVLEIEGDEMGECEVAGMGVGVTLAGGNVGSDFLQVTDLGVFVFDGQGGGRVCEWVSEGGKKITVAGCEGGRIVVAMGCEVVCLAVEGRKIEKVGEKVMEHEVSCIHLGALGAPSDGDMAGESSPSLLYAAVGLWTDNSVRVLRVGDLDEKLSVVLGGDTQARSTLVITMEGADMLLVGLGDGQLISYELSVGGGADDDGAVSILNKKKVSLGTQPISLSVFNSSIGSRCVFAASDRPTVVYSSNGKVSYANVNLPGEVTTVGTFHCEMFPNSLALASENTLMIGSIDDIQKLHVQVHKLGEGPRKIVHCQESRVFVVTVDGVDGGEGEETSHTVVFLEDQTFDEISRHKLDPFEVSLSMVNVTLTDEEGTEKRFVAVGTAVAHPDEEEPTEGRILVFEITKSHADNSADEVASVRLAMEKPVRGGVYSLAGFVGGRIVAGVNSKVAVYKYKGGDGCEELVNECTLHGHILALHMRTVGEVIVVGDLMRSVCVVEFKDGALKEVARDYNANFMLDVEMIAPSFYIGADMSSNLFTMRRNVNAASEEEKARLEVWGEFNLGQMVNKFVKGRLGGGPGDGDDKKRDDDVLYATSNGSLGAIFSLDAADYAFFGCVQKCLVKAEGEGMGGMGWDDFRSWDGERRQGKAKKFIDGDLLESFLDLDKEKQEEVVKLMDKEGGWDTNGLEKEVVEEGLGAIGEDGRVVLSLELVLAKVESMNRLHL